VIGKTDKSGVDMSPDAMMKRLREVSELFSFYQVIKTAKRIGPVEDDSAAQPPRTHTPE
jgi:hypothetical protein